jgi:N-methylhydantoinase A/oxoprolinase/acetone carboxylase beta subunit
MKALNYKREDLDFIKNSIRKEGIKSECYGIPLKEFMYQLIEMAENGLAEDEQKYLVSIKEMLEENSIPKMKTLSEYEKSGDLNSALAWCIPLRGV